MSSAFKCALADMEKRRANAISARRPCRRCTIHRRGERTYMHFDMHFDLCNRTGEPAGMALTAMPGGPERHSGGPTCVAMPAGCGTGVATGRPTPVRALAERAA